MDAFNLLKADHKKVAGLFDELESASGKAKLDVFRQIKSELELHTHLEETIFYPALEKPEETHDLTLEAYEEHKVVKTLLAELAGARTADDEWQAKAKVLRENVEHHVEEEENELFDKAEDALSDEEIQALGTRMEEEKGRKQGQPVPAKQEAKTVGATKAGAEKPGILSKLASLVGLGGSAKKATKKSRAKKAGARKPAKTTAQGVSKKKSGKSASATTAKGSATARASKRAGSRPSGSRKTSGAARSTRKAAKKSARAK